MNTEHVDSSPFSNPAVCRCLIDMELAETPEEVASAWEFLMDRYKDSNFVMNLIKQWTSQERTIQ